MQIVSNGKMLCTTGCSSSTDRVAIVGGEEGIISFSVNLCEGSGHLNFNLQRRLCFIINEYIAVALSFGCLVANFMIVCYFAYFLVVGHKHSKMGSTICLVYN